MKLNTRTYLLVAVFVVTGIALYMLYGGTENLHRGGRGRWRSGRRHGRGRWRRGGGGYGYPYLFNYYGGYPYNLYGNYYNPYYYTPSYLVDEVDCNDRCVKEFKRCQKVGKSAEKCNKELNNCLDDMCK